MSKLTGIVSIGPDAAIGANGCLLYQSPVDMAFFCGFTQGKLVVVGRKTAETILGTLPGRDVLCVSRSPDPFKNTPTPKCVRGVWDGVGGLCSLEKIARGREIVIAGGGEIYQMFAGKYDQFYVTVHPSQYDGRYGPPDAFFGEECLGALDACQKILSNEDFVVYRYYRAS